MAEDFKVGVGGSYKDVDQTDAVQVGVSSSWKVVEEMFVGVGGVWKRFYENVAALVNPSSVSVGPADVDSQTDTPSTYDFAHLFTATPTPADTGTTGGYDYNWTRTSNSGSNSAIMGTNGSATLSVSATLGDGETVSATYRCTVTGEDGSTQVFDSSTINWDYTDEGS